MDEKDKTSIFTLKLVLNPTTKGIALLDAMFDYGNQILNAVEDEGEKRVHRLRQLGERRMLVGRMSDLSKEKAKLRKSLASADMPDDEKNKATGQYIAIASELSAVKARLAEIKAENGFDRFPPAEIRSRNCQEHGNKTALRCRDQHIE